MNVQRTPGSDVVTELILEVFRLNGRLLAAGDVLVADLGLTSARWQVLGAIAISPALEPVARLARRMGLTRQAVQRVVNDLEHLGLVEFRTNPHHQRAQLVGLTAKGRGIYDQAHQRQAPWANHLAEGLDPGELQAAIRTIRQLTARLE